MDDHELEERLRRYRPAGPPPELRERSLLARGRPEGLHYDSRGAGDSRGASDSRSVGLQARVVWWQFAVAAALLVVALLLQSATARIDRRIALLTAPARAADETRLDDLTRELGGDRSARAMAEAMLVHERVSERSAVLTLENQP